MSLQSINTKVCIIGAGSAGLLIANILNKYGISCVVIEQLSRNEVYARSEASLIDYKTVSILREHGLGDRLLRVATPNGKCEFRTPKQSFIFDYAKMTGGQTHYIYPQQELIADLIERFQGAGGQILFETQAITIANESYGAKIFCEQPERDLIINADFIAGCDGFDSVARSFMPESVTQPQTIPYNYSWLSITAEATPSTERIIYGVHPRGFAGYMLGISQSRYYLQIPMQDTATEWSCDRIWAELQLRLAKNNRQLITGKIIQKRVLNMSSFATQTMQYKSIFLAGDAAHIFTPPGDKGINIAIQDADVLAQAFTRFYRYHDNLSLIGYSTSRLPAIRQTQEFSESLLQMINLQTSNGKESNNLLQLLQKFKLSQLMHSKSYALDFAQKYVGYIATEQSVAKSKLSSVPPKLLATIK